MKEQGRNSKNKQTNKQINEEEITTLPEREFRIMIIKTL